MPRARAARCCVREVGLCCREYIWSVQKENYTFIQYNTCRVELTPHREKSCSLLTAILTRLLSVQFSQAGVNYFQCITPQKTNKQNNNNNNTKTTGVGRIVELYSRLINPTNHFPAASIRLEVTSASSSRLLPRTSGDSSVDRHLLVQRRRGSSTSLLASATTPVSPA